MHAIGYEENLPIENPASLVGVPSLPIPEPGPHDLLVRVRAASVNPVDVKLRASSPPPGGLRILGFDAAGVVEAVGGEVSRFAPGDEVFYAGSISRSGSDAELQLVDERVTGRKPASLDFAHAAALPLTSITAWESLFDHLALGPDTTGTLVVVGAAGGVGSMVTQLARTRTRLTVIGTASRPDSQAWATEMGAHHVVDHHDRLAEQVLALAPDGVEYVFSTHSPPNIEAYAQMLRPFGHVVAIDDEPGDIAPLKAKSIAWHWESMFTRPTLLPEDDAQHRVLQQVADLVDAGTLRSTATTVLEPLDAATLREAHRMIESSATIGKVVVAVGTR